MNDAERLELPHVIGEDASSSFDEIRGKGGYYDRSGNAISFRDWARLMAWDDKNEHKYRIVQQEYVDHYWISTVFLGLDHGWGGALKLFETMVFNQSPEIPERPKFPSETYDPDSDEWNEFFENYPEQTQSSDVECERYTTEAEALEGHQRMVDKVRLLVEALRKEG